MNNISVVISGNLTGFSRFYASPGANDILNENKFDFDYRNFLAFLNFEEKAYVVSYAPSVLAVSVVTRILDSFRRPGILVVTVLLPRRSKVESVTNSQNKNALYQLLYELNAKFYEKNFVNGMVNQNAAVLMQDYYTDILANYAIVPDGMQRPVNARIDVASPNKRLGYVQTSEENVPLYLASPCRRSYEGCHHIVFAQNPVQNLIAEEPTEVVYYRVKITNNGQSLPSVVLNDRIPNLRPEEGEIDINKNFTYQQILNGDAGRDIIGNIDGETIELTYRFGLEEKTIKFLFTEGGKPVPFNAIMPVLEYNGTRINISSETFSFQGKEIYGQKRIKSRTPDYRIKRESEFLDLRRVQDTCIIEVEHCFPVVFDFNPPEDKPKRIIFKRKNQEQSRYEVTNHLDVVLPGSQEEYSYIIESPHYEKITGFFAPPGTQFKLPPLKPVNRFTPSSKPVNQRSNTETKGSNPGGAIHLVGETTYDQPRRRERSKLKKAMPYAVGLFSLCLVSFMGAFLWQMIFSDDKNSLEDNTSEDTAYNQIVKIYFCDSSPSHDFLESKNFDNNCFKIFDSIARVSVLAENEDSVMFVSKGYDGNRKLYYTYKLTVPNDKDIFIYTCKIFIEDNLAPDGNILIGSCILNSKDFNKDTKNVIDTLYVKTSELKLYNEVIACQGKKITNDEKNQFISKAGKIDLIELSELIKRRVDQIEIDQNPRLGDTHKPDPDPSTTDPDDGLNETIPDNVLTNIKNADNVKERKLNKNDFSEAQWKLIQDYNDWQKNVYTNKEEQERKDLKKMLSNCKRYSGVKNIIEKFK